MKTQPQPKIRRSSLTPDTVNREYFVVEILSDSLACTKIKHAKMHARYKVICLLNMKNILDMKYSRFMVQELTMNMYEIYSRRKILLANK